MKRLIFLIFTIICGIILYTCASPVAVEGLQQGTGTYYSSKPIIVGRTTGNDIFLGVEVTSSSIRVGLTVGDGNNAAVESVETVNITNVENGNAISGTYPNISFQDGVISGTIRYISDNQIKISFQQRIYPYTKMWDVVCETRN